jgi:hypothetical protein
LPCRRRLVVLSWTAVLTTFCVALLSQGSVYLVDDLEECLQGGVAPLRVAPADADHAWPGGVQGELHPWDALARTRGGRQITNNQVWVEAGHLLFERLEPRDRHLDVRAQHLDASPDHLSVGTVIVLQSDQYPDLDCSCCATDFDSTL